MPHVFGPAFKSFAAVQDLHGMIDAAKYADLVLLMVDGGFGFEMETFEFLNLLQVCHATQRPLGNRANVCSDQYVYTQAACQEKLASSLHAQVE